ncbi:hypothetical protein FIBSPDRAFT_540478 [Athelia psychrophila]|uniref:Uncharacterized protein n=1 Tax=Athelia psychrophila TaxID=1759441 RepID=A0A166IXB7_9AGAM|nr:hypothetical protein FIBSPDRAFT_540478 [Fibularhizoctonia sp. CBS 109695]
MRGFGTPSRAQDGSSNTPRYARPVDWVPIEIWTVIFRLACVGDGRTGCALSRVCKYIRNASAPFRYYSVALKGLASLLLFAELLESSPNISVTHLFITNDPRHTYSRKAGNANTPAIPDASHPKMARKRDKVKSMLFPKKYNQHHVESQTNGQQPKRRDIVQEALRGQRLAKHFLMNSTCNILRYQSQSLITLSLAYYFTGHETLVPVTFPNLPRLKELTIAVASSSHPPEHELALMKNLSRFPALLRFDLLGMIVPTMDVRSIILQLLRYSPMVTHFGLPVVHAYNLLGAGPLLQATMLLLADNQHPLHMFLQANPWNYAELSITQRRALGSLQAMIESTFDERLHFMQREDAIQHFSELQGKNWEDRILGGIGGWFESAGPDSVTPWENS